MRGRTAAWIGAAWIAAFASPVLAQDGAVDQAARRGTELFWLDRAAWVSSDDMAARLPKDRRMEIASWIIVPGGEDITPIGSVGTKRRTASSTRPM